MKRRQRVIAAMLTFALCFSMGFAALAGFSHKATAELTASLNEIYSGTASGHRGYGTIENNAGSAGGAGVALEISDGSGWVEYAHAEADPGDSNSTSTWGQTSYEYLFRVKAYSTTYWMIGNPGRIATAKLYTDM